MSIYNPSLDGYEEFVRSGAEIAASSTLTSTAAGADHARLDATTRAVLDLLITDPTFRREHGLPLAPEDESWGNLHQTHLMAILRTATRGLFLRGDDLVYDRSGVREGRNFETQVWFEDWIVDRLSPYFQASPSEQFAAALEGKFRYLGRECRLDFINEFQKRNRVKRGSQISWVDDRKPEYFYEPVPPRFWSVQLTRNLAPAGVLIRACLNVFGHLGDLTQAAIAEEIAQILQITVARAEQLMRRIRSQIKSMLPNSPVLQSLRNELLDAIHRPMTLDITFSQISSGEPE